MPDPLMCQRKCPRPHFPLLLAAALATSASAAECDALLARHLETDMALDYEAFDQTPGSGFRVLAEANCPRQAADLIEAWMAHTGGTEHSLGWHIAQLRASAGQTDVALVAARASLRAEEPADEPFRWNDYVRATIAFLKKDRAAFDQARAGVAAYVDAHPGNAINLALLDRLGRHFHASYAEASAVD